MPGRIPLTAVPTGLAMTALAASRTAAKEKEVFILEDAMITER